MSSPETEHELERTRFLEQCEKYFKLTEYELKAIITQLKCFATWEAVQFLMKLLMEGLLKEMTEFNKKHSGDYFNLTAVRNRIDEFDEFDFTSDRLPPEDHEWSKTSILGKDMTEYHDYFCKLISRFYKLISRRNSAILTVKSMTITPTRFLELVEIELKKLSDENDFFEKIEEIRVPQFDSKMCRACFKVRGELDQVYVKILLFYFDSFGMDIGEGVIMDQINEIQSIYARQYMQIHFDLYVLYRSANKLKRGALDIFQFMNRLKEGKINVDGTLIDGASSRIKKYGNSRTRYLSKRHPERMKKEIGINAL